jgi:SAM-dependent methyltransferase
MNFQPSEVVGIDRSFEAISFAVQNFRKSNLSYLMSDGEKLPFGDGKFDIVVSSQVIEHVLNYEKYLTEILRVLKRTGILIIGTPNKQTFNPNGKPMPFHFKEFFADEFVQVMQRFFKKVEICGQYNLKLTSKKNARESLIRFGNNQYLAWIPALFRIKVGKRLTTLLNLNEEYRLEDFKIREFDASTSMNIICICSDKKTTEEFKGEIPTFD